MYLRNAWFAVILWPVLLALPFTKDRKEEIGRLLGEDEAIQENIETKRCAYPNREQRAGLQAEQPAPAEAGPKQAEEAAQPVPVPQVKANEEATSDQSARSTQEQASPPPAAQ